MPKIYNSKYTLQSLFWIVAFSHLLTDCTGIPYRTHRPQLLQNSSPLKCDERNPNLAKPVKLEESFSSEVLCRHLLFAELNHERNIATINLDTISPKNQLGKTQEKIQRLLSTWGYVPKLQPIFVPRPSQHDIVTTNNIEVEIKGVINKDEIILIGAHYDSAIGSQGANDNGTGVVATLELARRLKQESFKPDRTIRFVFFTNEEEPYFDPDKPEHEYMGSRYYAKTAKLRCDKIKVMMSLETMGFYTNQPETQCLWPAMQPVCAEKSNCSTFNALDCIIGPENCPDCQPQTLTDFSGRKYPKCIISASGLWSPLLWTFNVYQPKGDFILFAGNLNSKTWVNRAVMSFRNAKIAKNPDKFVNLDFPAEAIYSWGNWMPGINWSDHRSFWEEGYQAFMVTDTAPNRNFSYHRLEDDVSVIQFDYLEKVVTGLIEIVRSFGSSRMPYMLVRNQSRD